SQEILQPVDRFQVQTVRWLIEQQYIRISKQRLRKEYPDLQISGDVLHQAVVKFFLYPQAAEQIGRFTFRFVTPHFTEFHFEFAGPHAVFFRKIGLGIEGFAFFRYFPERFMSHQYGVQWAEFVKLEVVLFEYCHTLTRSDFQWSFAVNHLAGNNFQESRFAGAICTDDAVAIALCKLNIDFIKQYPGAKIKGEIFYADHNTTPFSK